MFSTKPSGDDPSEKDDLSETGDLPLAAPGRYTLIHALGLGGMGEVWLARDALLEREVAMKLLRAGLFESAPDRARFVEEARIQARLQHPDIVPLYDFGVLPDEGRPFFTMRVVRGETLAEACGEPATEGPALRHRVGVVRRVAEAIGYAHRQGLIHRDLKPHNVLLGDSGEVTLVDWGIGRRMDGGPVMDQAGTRAYMAPEVHTRGAADLRVDLYGLGAILLHAVIGAPPAWPDPIEDQIPGVLSRDLAELIRASTRSDRRERLWDAGAFARALADWLEGALERERALRHVEEARARRQAMVEDRARIRELRAEVQRLSAEVRPWAPIEDKRPCWVLEEEIEALTRRINLGEVEVTEALGAALRRAADLPEARDLLADHYQERHASAEAEGDQRAAAQAEVQLRAVGEVRHAAWLAGRGRLTLVTDPPGAEATLHRFEERDRRLVAVEVGALGQTPLVDLALDRGDWLLTLRAPGRAEVRYPVSLGRCERWDGVPPGGSEPWPVALPPAGALGADDVYVPAGWSWVGGDARAPRSLPRQRVWVDAFVIRRFPVTNAEYIEFLDDLVAQGRAEEAEEMVPGRVGGAPIFACADGRWAPCPDDEGFVYPLDWPVTLIDWDMARAYARWLAGREGRPWRLPFELEWERAARGVEGRIYPWGRHFDATFCRTSESAPRPFPVGVGEVALDVSVWGVRGLAGNALCWCLDRYRLEGPEILQGSRAITTELRLEDRDSNRVIRGAGYTGTELLARSATRHPYTPQHRSDLVGLRVLRQTRGV